MNLTTASPASEVLNEQVLNEEIATAVRDGLTCLPKRLPPWLFYDAEGSRLFEDITGLPEYYLTRTERSIFADFAEEILEKAGDGSRLRIVELGAGSAEKTRLLLKAAVETQGSLLYEPVDVSGSALQLAKQRIEGEIPGVRVAPLEMDYTNGFRLTAAGVGERRLVLYIVSSIGNFEPEEAARLLRKVRSQLAPGDGLMLGVDLVKDESILLDAYDDAAGVTAAFNKNMLARLNRELGGDFDLEAFRHRAVWNEARSRIEMHLESHAAQTVRLERIDLDVDFAAGETIHTENSYKYRPGEPEALLAETGFAVAGVWTDVRGWFAVCLGQATCGG